MNTIELALTERANAILDGTSTEKLHNVERLLDPNTILTWENDFEEKVFLQEYSYYHEKKKSGLIQPLEEDNKKQYHVVKSVDGCLTERQLRRLNEELELSVSSIIPNQSFSESEKLDFLKEKKKEEVAIHPLLLEAMNEAFEYLTEKQQYIVIEKTVHGRSYKEIADEIGVEQSSVRKNGKNALDKMRRYIESVAVKTWK